ncbi:Maf family protein [Desulforhopalus singaporensis]|uniref:dTTP/UTP pyrophosphatase n=1 Tax=Desulforhopalus singaporensis TaxID=91360 RepID=A0A1H0J778_9BACT|nr:Maf family protein [Desulforhopalus singaporensis]SDO39586.1 septum formation protein [Desulforhopalus singaporensis]
MYCNSEPIILASGSPRRIDFLQSLGLEFSVCATAIDEDRNTGESPEDFVRRMAVEKCRAISVKNRDSWVIGGDTIVCIDDAILGKPVSAEEAVSMLMRLSGRVHLVRSSFCVNHEARSLSVSRVVATRVVFGEFSEDVAKSYVAGGESLDKAGGYGIQGKGTALVKEIQGSYSNVVGLPLFELTATLLQLGVIRPRVVLAR